MNPKETMRTRRTLLERIVDVEDTQAWYEFVYYYRGYIYGVLHKMNVSHHDAEEIIQAVLLKVSEIIHGFEYDPTKGRFRGYLARITANAARNHFRSSHNNVSLDETIENCGIPKELSSDSELEQLADKEWEEHLYRLAWQNVSGSFGDNMRKCWEMLYADVSIQKIAADLNISESSIYVYKKRIQEKMKSEIKRLRLEIE
ncbi:MAG: sigma-70 family RNA polymerase sigma factor [Lentisphaerae bacterium]|nr:sigma-70 family RNA polymerase sigma factor [Lentisphaerota bacterium]MCP4103348.1 sigma-70 family RNA polymerase sigma factor [Lentisphaerota bacterium]